jgi:hypothetical protein
VTDSGISPAPRQRKRSWREATRRYLSDPSSNRFLRVLAVKVAPWIFGATVVDDALALIPGAGLITLLDNVSWPVFIIMFARAIYQINKYRKVQPPATDYGRRA